MSRHHAAILEARERFGTPFYIYDLEAVRARTRMIRETVPPRFALYYSVKANPNLHLIREIIPHFDGLEVASIGEALAGVFANIPPERMMFVGPMKKPENLTRAYRLGLRRFIMESRDQLEAVRTLGLNEAQIILRVNPDVRVQSSTIKMGGAPTQFGIDFRDLPEVWTLLHQQPELRFRGYHTYCGTQIDRVDTTIRIMHAMIRIYRETPASLREQIDFLDFGGGFSYGVDAVPQEYDLPDLANRLKEAAPELPADVTCAFELGRFVCAPLSQLCTSVVTIKESRGKQFAICDCGINGFFSFASQSPFKRRNHGIHRIVGGPDPIHPEFEGDIVGPLCTPADQLATNVRFDSLAQGDVLVFENCGAYGLTHSLSLFLSHDAPAEIAYDASTGALHVIRDRSVSVQVFVSQGVAPERASEVMQP